MQVTVKPIKEKSQAELTVSIPAQDFAPYIERAARRLTKEKPLPGFRPGKAPLPVVLEAYGQERVLHDALDKALPHFFVQAALDFGVDAINRPSIAIKTLGLSEVFEFTATVDVLPEVTLGDLSQLKAEENKIEVKDEEVEQELKYLAKMREKKFEEVDDAFAKSLGKFENVNDLKQKLKDNIQHEKEHKEADRRRGKLMEQLSAQASYGFIPEVLLEREIDSRLQELAQMLTLQNRSVEDYLEKQKKTLKDLRTDMRSAAEKAVKIGLAMRAFAKEQKIEVSDEEIEAQAREYLARHGDLKTAAEKTDLGELRENITLVLRNRKALDRLEEIAGVKL